MNNFTGAFSLYEVFRILVPGFYFTIMLGELFINASQKLKWHSFDAVTTLIFIITSIILGALLYALDIPRWFKKCYSTLPSKLMKENKLTLEIEDKSSRSFEDRYFRFYYSLSAHTIFKTEIQSGIFHLLMTMSFIGIITMIIHELDLGLSVHSNEYFCINIFITVVSITGAFIIYKSKLRHTWKRNYDEFADSLKNDNKLHNKRLQQTEDNNA